MFRGLTIAAMIVVNSSGSDDVYPTLDHAPWHGCTFADFVFPSFLVIMGISMSLSLRGRLERGQDRGAILQKVFQRSVVIVLLGLLMNVVFYASGALPVFRYYGVLQRIGLCYLLASALFLTTGWKGQAVAAAAILAGYWALIGGDLTPHGSLPARVDRALFAGHLYTPDFDPEGLLGTLPSTATTLLGLLAGRWLGTRGSAGRKAAGLVAGGAVLALLGREWSAVLPLNKHLWTSSFVFWTGGLSLASFGAFYGLIEIRGALSSLKPLEWFGRNSLLSYFISGLIYGAQEFFSVRSDGGRVSVKIWLTNHLFATWLQPRAASLAYALVFTSLCLLLMSELHRREWFFKV